MILARLFALLLLAIIPFLLSPPHANQTALLRLKEIGSPTLILKNAKILTMNEDAPLAEALALEDEKVVAVGNSLEVEALKKEGTQIIDLQGNFVTPGIIESHAHLMGIAESLTMLNLKKTHSPEEIIEKVRVETETTAKDHWIIGQGWDQNDWARQELPNHAELSKISPDHPVYLSRIDGHAAWVNQKALSLAGIYSNTPDPEGGKILRDASGNATGVLLDRATELVQKKISRSLSKDERMKALQTAVDRISQSGITSFHEAGASNDDIDAYEEISKSEKLRLYIMLNGSDAKLLEKYFAKGPQIPEDNSFLTIRSVKLFADGALGSRGALLFEDYSDQAGTTGLSLMTEEQIYQVSKQALSKGFQVATHAIGDKANHWVLNAYEHAIKDYLKENEKQDPLLFDPRLRIEHAQILDTKDIPRFGQMGIIASIQPTHATSDMPWAEKRLGEYRIEEGAYAWQKLLKSGALLIAGSDAPVEDFNPLLGFYAAITRQDTEGNPKGGWHSDQKLTRLQALKAFTLDAARGEFSEKAKGSLEPGKLGDIVVWSKDLLTEPASELLKTKALMTIVGGEILHSEISNSN